MIANTIIANGGDAITVGYNSGVNLINEPRRDGPNLTTPGYPIGGAVVRCATGGYVDGPVGKLAGAGGLKSLDSGCVDRTVTP